jgi:DNA-directed RNA polymerase specialized sigma24 family protein
MNALHATSIDKGTHGSLPASMSPTPIEESEAELTALGERLRKHDAESAAIDRDLADATQRAQTARLSMDEIADRVGVSRSTLYNAQRRAKNQAAAKSRPGTRRSKPPKS